MKPSELAYLGVVRRRSSSLLAILAIGLAIGISGSLITLQKTLSESFSDFERGIDVLVGPKSSSLRLLIDGLYFNAGEGGIIGYQLKKTLEEEIGPKLIVPFSVFAHHRGIPVIGTEDSLLTLFRIQDTTREKTLESGRWFNLNTDDPEVVMGHRAAALLGIQAGDRIRVRSNLKTREGRSLWDREVFIVGVLNRTGQPHDRAMFTPIEWAWETHLKGFNEGVVHKGKMTIGASWLAIVMDPEKPEQMDELRDAVQRKSAAQFLEVDRELEWLRKLLGQGRNLTGAITFLSLFLSTSVLLLLFIERSEMTRCELGLYRALGYSKKEVFLSTFWEAIYLGILGLSLGMVLERGIHSVVQSMWNPGWLTPTPWPSDSLIFLWFIALVAILLIPWIAIIRLYRAAANEALAAY